MAQGIERREAVTDSLAGAAEVVPVVSSAAPLSAPQVQVHSQNYSDAAAQYGVKRSAEIAGSLNKWAGDKLQVLANTQREAAVLDGQMAYQQGKTMEAVEMEGDKWALSGYRVMNAQTLSQTMLATQRDMIQQSQYEQDPDEFRAQYISRMEAQIDGLDPQTARMVREQMSEQMPILVSEHTSAHLGYQEREAYKSLVTSVDALSKDASAFGALLDNAAGGPGSPSAGLSEDRRMSAVVDGVGAAFENMNPVAYQQLKQSGLMDKMSTAQKQTMRNAQQAYENRVRGTYDEEHTEALSNFQRRLEAGDLEPAEAAEALATIYGRRNITMSAAEGGAAYNGAVTAQDHGDRARVANIGTAIARGDIDAVARLTQDIVEHFESGGDANAIGPLITSGANAGDRAQGAMQVMPKTLDDPGYGIVPSNGTPADDVRVGRDYWAMLLKRYDGDIEAAAVGYNAGPGNGDKFKYGWTDTDEGSDTFGQSWGPGDWSGLKAAGVRTSETRPYAEGISSVANGEALHYSTAERLTKSEAELRSARTLRDKILTAKADAAVVEADIAYADDLAELKIGLDNGTVQPQAFRAQAEQLRDKHGVTQTLAQANTVNSAITAAATAARKNTADAADIAKDEALELVQVEQAVLYDGLTRTLNTPGITVQQADAASAKYLQDVGRLYGEAGFTLKETAAAKVTGDVLKAQRAAEKKIEEYKADGVIIKRAAQMQDLGSLTPEQRARYDKELLTTISKQVSDGVASGTVKNDQIQGLVSQAMEASAVDTGAVTRDEQASATSNLMNSVGQDGKPTPAAIATVMKYGRLFNDNPKAANSMLSNPKATNIMAEIFESAQGDLTDPQRVGDAIWAAHRARETSYGISEPFSPVVKDRVAAEIESGVRKWMKQEDIGVLQGMFDSDTDISQAWKQTNVEQAQAGSDATFEELAGAVTVQAHRLIKEDPAMSTAIAVQRAQALVLDRTAIIGGTAHVMEPGYNMLDQMFGDLASTYKRPGIENEVITDYLAYLSETDPTLAWISEVSVWEANPFAPSLSAIGDTIANTWGGGVEQPAFSTLDAIAVANRGVRPHVSRTDGKHFVGIRVLDQAGDYGPEIQIPLATAGTVFALRRQKELSE